MTGAIDGPRSLYSFRETFARTERRVADHVLDGVVTIAGVCQIDLVHECAQRVGLAPERSSFEKVRFCRSLIVEDDSITVGVNLTLEADRGLRFEVVDPHNRVCSTGRIRTVPNDCGQSSPIDPWAREGCIRLTRADIATSFIRRGSTYGRTFQGLEAMAIDGESGVGTIIVDPDSSIQVSAIHPTVVDAALQSSLGLIETLDLSHRDDERFVPFYIEKLTCYSSSWDGIRYGSRVERNIDAGNAEYLVFDVLVFDDIGRPIVGIDRFCLRRLSIGRRRQWAGGS